MTAYCLEHDLGPDALALDVADLRRLVRGYRGGVKPLLMDLLRHREDHATCPRGNGEVQRTRLGGRGVYYCPACQR